MKVVDKAVKNAPLDYDPVVRDQIDQLLQELRSARTPEMKELIYSKLDKLILGLSSA